MSNNAMSRPQPIAIVGIGCRFPGGVVDPVSFWRLLDEGRDAITEVPADRIDLGHYFDARAATPGRIMSRWGGFLSHIDEFDADFFGISPREAERLDPQQRLLLETAWEALEDAGIDTARLDGSNTAVFVGQWLNDFEARLFADPEGVDFYMTTGSGRYAASGRLSYLLGLRGPSLTLDTACSSSLAAVHLAVRSIRSGESDLAIAGGVNVVLQPHISIAYSQSRMMAPDGHCKFGDAGGDGYVRSEGAGLVVLKPLQRALDDGDRIYAVVRGSAVNNDGRSSGSMGTPSRIGQEELLRSAYRDAGLPPSRVGYVEAHGTGTRAGDPVELGALAAVLGEDRPLTLRTLVGSVKTNMGHTEGAAGVAGLIKAALALHHEHIPKSLHCKVLNPAIPWAEMPLAVAREAMPWPRGGQARVAGVSAFGIAGTNAHVVLEEAPPLNAVETEPARATSLLVLSARSEAALKALAARYAERMLQVPDEEVASICWNAATRRAQHDHRAAFVATGGLGLVEALRQYGAGGAASAEGRAIPGERARVAFVCPGQGAQWPGMARELMAREPVFRAALERCDAAMAAHADWSIVEQLTLEPDDPRTQLERIDVIQPVLVAIALAYAELWRHHGVVPDAVVGHSMGEVAAACIAGVLSLDVAMRIICRRSTLMRRTSGQGAMALVDLPMAEAQRRIAGREHEVAVAVSNSPRSCVISGRPEAVHALMAAWEAENVFCRLVKVDVASHSPQMQPLADALSDELAGLRPQADALPLYSTVLARRAEPHELGAAYWGSNLRQAVRFGATVERLIADGITVFVELGPHPVLLPAVEQTAQSVNAEVSLVACARRGEPDEAAWLTAAGLLHGAGVALDWRRLMPGSQRFVPLPTYPWQRERHWISAADLRSPGSLGQGRALASHHPVLGTGVELAGNPPGALWPLSLEPARVPAWFEHALHGSALLPASAYLEMALAAARALSPDTANTIEDLRFERALHLQTDAACALQLQAVAQDGSALRLVFQTHSGQAWVPHAAARLTFGSREAAGSQPSDLRRLQVGPALDKDETYRRLAASGAFFGPRLQCIASAWLQADEALVQIGADVLGEAVPRGFLIAPAALDACFQAAVLLAPAGELHLPVAIRHAQLLRSPVAGALQVYLRRLPDEADGTLLDLTLLDSEGPVLTLNGVRLQPFGASAAQAGEVFHELHWVPVETASDAAPATDRAGSALPAPARRWCLLPDHGGLASALAAALRQAGGHAELIGDPASGVDWPAGEAIELIDLRALDLPAPGDDAHDTALHGLVRTAQTLDAQPVAGRVRLRWVTRAAQVVRPDDAAALSLAQASAVGLAAVLAVEQGGHWGGLIDLDPARPAGEQAAALARQLMNARPGMQALRGADWFEPRLRRCIATALTAAAPWRRDASYLITGGLGGVGRQVARWLVDAGVRHLVVLSRTPLPARDHWAGLAPDSREARAVAALRELEALGASVTPVALDVADGQDLQDWLQRWQAEARPPIRGVFHAAGLTDDKLVRDLDAASLAAVLRPKLRGACHLHRLLPELDAFVLFSSMAAVLPQAGQASYAAANAFLDALARHRRAQGQPALSIGWGVWAQTGVMQGDIGRRQQEELLRQGVGSFTSAQALAVFGAVLGWPSAHVLAMPMDWARVAAQRSGRPEPLLQELLDEVRANAAADAAPAAPGLGEHSDPAERRRAIELAVREVVGRVLKLPPARVDPRKPLGSMGLTSLMALELRNRLEPLHGKPLSATLAWNYPTVEALSAFLAGGDEPAVAATAPTSAPADAPEMAVALDDIHQLSDEDAALLLRQRR